MKGKIAFPAGIPQPAQYDEHSAAAIKALHAGNASPEQQKVALNWIVFGAAMYGAETFVPGKGDLATYFTGRRSVALQVLFLRDTPMKTLLQKETT